MDAPAFVAPMCGVFHLGSSQLRTLALSLAAAFGLAAASSAEAAIIGVTTNQAGTSTVGATENRPALGGTSIRYFIPLSDNSGTYGVSNGGTFGLNSDFGNGGGLLTMYVKFSGLTVGQLYNLIVRWEDLDLTPVNDPNGFTENLQVRRADGTNISGLITALGATPNGGGTVTGNATSQLLTLAVGAATAADMILRFDFRAAFTGNATNSAEFLRAELSPVPVPAALPLMMAGLAGLGFASRKKAKA